MLVQLDGQVLQFSVASVAQLAPLHKSTCLDCKPFCSRVLTTFYSNICCLRVGNIRSINNLWMQVR